MDLRANIAVHCLFSNLGQDIYLYPLHALRRVWEDHHRKWSHRVFPEILLWCHTTNRSVSNFLTSTQPPLSLSVSPFSPLLPLSLHPRHPPKHYHFPSSHWLQDIHSHNLWCVKLQTYSNMALCSGFNLRWTICCGWQRDSEGIMVTLEASFTPLWVDMIWMA